MYGTISGTIHRFTYQTFFSRSVLSGVFAVAVRVYLKTHDVTGSEEFLR